MNDVLLTRPLASQHILRIVWRAFLEYFGQLSLKIAVVAGLHREFLNEDGEVAAQNRPEDVGLLMAGLIILEIVAALDGHFFPIDSTTDGIDYYVADVELRPDGKTYRVIWLFEGDRFEILGVVNAYRKRKK